MESRLRRVPGVLWLNAADTVVALPPGSRMPAVIGGSGASLWLAFADPTPMTVALAHLARSYALPPEQIRPDVEAAVGALMDLGLLEEVA